MLFEMLSDELFTMSQRIRNQERNLKPERMRAILN